MQEPHQAIVTGGGHESMTNEFFTWVNRVIGNVKNSLKGRYHSLNPKHLPRYLAEFCYRFNRSFAMKAMAPRLGCRQREPSRCQNGFTSWLTHSGNQECFY